MFYGVRRRANGNLGSGARGRESSFIRYKQCLARRSEGKGLLMETKAGVVGVIEDDDPPRRCRS